MDAEKLLNHGRLGDYKNFCAAAAAARSLSAFRGGENTQGPREPIDYKIHSTTQTA